jgi:hypothetical protein
MFQAHKFDLNKKTRGVQVLLINVIRPQNKNFALKRRIIHESRFSKLIKKLLCPFNLALPSEKKHNFGATLGDFLTEKDVEKLKQNRDDLLKCLNFTQKYSDHLREFEVTKEVDNDVETFKEAFRGLVGFTIDKRYRTTFYEYWRFLDAIYRQRVSLKLKNLDLIICRICGSTSSKYNSNCDKCGNPLGE